MLYLASDRSSSPTELWPARALLTPTWIFALALLVANDHWLKGSGLLPGVVTGKLSDFAGMLVAPTLLAALIAVRTRGALAACHVAVAIVFTGIQLSTGFAAQWSALMGVFGHPWTITCDPTDLIALPFLLLSWKLLVPEMDPKLPALVPVQRTAVGALSVFGLWSTVATSDTDAFLDDSTWYEDVYGHVYINNANDYEIALFIRPLRDDLVIDCDAVSSDPGRMLDEDAFGEAVHWVLPARTNVAIDLLRDDCGAAWVAGEGIEPRIVFVDHIGYYTPAWFPGQTFEPATLGASGLGITFDDQGHSEWTTSGEILFVPKSEQLEQPAGCEAMPEEARIDWPSMVPTRDVSVIAVEPGVDGCFELEVQELIMTSELEPFGAPYGFYVCAPAAAMPVEAGEFLRFAEQHDGFGGRELTLITLDGATLQPMYNEDGRLVRQIRLMRGVNSPTLLDGAIGRPMVAVDHVSCPWQIEAEQCATVERTIDLAVAGEGSFLPPGKSVSFADATTGMVHTAVLAYARQHSVIDLACADGSTQLRYDLDLAVIDEPLQ